MADKEHVSATVIVDGFLRDVMPDLAKAGQSVLDTFSLILIMARHNTVSAFTLAVFAETLVQRASTGVDGPRAAAILVQSFDEISGIIKKGYSADEVTIFRSAMYFLGHNLTHNSASAQPLYDLTDPVIEMLRIIDRDGTHRNFVPTIRPLGYYFRNPPSAAPTV